MKKRQGWNRTAGTWAGTVIFGLLLSGIARPAGAAVVETVWQGATSGLWADAARWNKGAPVSTNYAHINNGTTKTVTINAATSADNLTIAQLNVECNATQTNTLLLSGNTTPLIVNGEGRLQVSGALIIDGGSMVQTNANFYLGAYAPRCVLTVTNGLFIDYSELILGANAGSDGWLNIQGGSAVTVKGAIHVANNATSVGKIQMTGGTLTSPGGNIGRNGVGSMTVSDGTWLTTGATTVGANAGSFGSMVISGGSTEWKCNSVIGNNVNATGSVLITGGTLAVTNMQGTTLALVIGSYGVGSLTVTNSGAWWTTNGFSVGYYAGSRGTLNIAGGVSRTLGGQMKIGVLAGGTGTVTVTGGEFIATNNNDEILIGQSGYGRLLTSAGSMSVSRFYVGYDAGSSGEAVIGGGTTWAPQFITLGRVANATGTVTVTAGDLVVTNTAATANLQVGDAGRGTLTLNGGTTSVDLFRHGPRNVLAFNGGALNTKSTLITNGLLFAVGNGTSEATLNLVNGTHTFSSGLAINSNAALRIAGTNAVGAAIITGSLTLRANSRLEWAFTATTQGLAKVTGALTLEGPVTVKLTSLDGALPQRFPMVTTTGGITGSPVGWPLSRVNGQAYEAYLNGNALWMRKASGGTAMIVY